MNKNTTNQIKEELEEAGYDYALAFATTAEIEAGAACGQLAIIVENQTAPDARADQ